MSGGAGRPAGGLTAAQWRVVLSALSRAQDEWTAAVEHDEDHGYDGTAAVRRDIATLVRARENLVRLRDGRPARPAEAR